MRVLVFTNMYPFAEMPFYGSFVRQDVEALRSAGVDVDVYFVNGKKSKAAYLGMLSGFRRRVAENKYDLVHVHHSYCAWAATKNKRLPVVWTFHEGEVVDATATARADRWFKRLAYSKSFKKRLAEKVDVLIVVADAMRIALGRDDAVTLPSAINVELFRPIEQRAARTELGIATEGPVALFPSTRKRVEKRFELAQQAVEHYRNSGKALTLISLEDVPHEKVPLYMNAADVVLMTSAFEASPVTIREALACETPVVSTDVGDVAGVVAGLEGCSVRSASPGDLAQGIAEALAAGQIASRERMMAYTPERTAAKIIELYQTVLARN